LFTTERIDAATAERWGLVNKVVPHERLREETEALARQIAKLDAVAIDWAKKAMKVLPGLSLETASHYGGMVGAQARAARGEPRPDRGA
jgi:enoyl-CoA hydratase/carnithine racemase